ncbi:MAG: tetratricopeptide repeat protein [Chloroflexota bacterium]
MTSEYIIEVSEKDFEYEVLTYSQHIPVVVDFWAPWCSPCKILGPILEKLTEEAEGAFRLAKVNVDENPNLAIRYNVRGIPAVKGIFREEVVFEFTGVQPEPKIRAFLRELAPTPTDLTLEKGISLLSQHEWSGAETLLREVLDNRPEEAEALLGLVKCLLAQGQVDEALNIITDFPASRQYSNADTLRPFAEALVKLKTQPTYNDDPLKATYQHALELAGRGNIPAAIDGLLDILRQDKNFENGQAQKVILALLELLGEHNPLTRTYRKELANVLF